MKDYLPIFVSVIAGLFAIFSALFAWQLKQSSEIKLRELSGKDSSYKELKSLYIKVHEMFEELIKETKQYGSSNLSSRFSKLTAELYMIASCEVKKKYLSVGDQYAYWAPLYNKAYPAPIKNGASSYVLIQAPDPTLKYKQPEKEAYVVFYEGYQELIGQMRSELAVRE